MIIPRHTMKRALLRHLSLASLRPRLPHPSPDPFSNILSRRQYASAAVAEVKTVLFPREGPGTSYALNWALAVKGVPPKGDVFRNLKDSELRKYGAVESDPISGCSLYARGNFSAGANDISKAQFNRLLKEVTSHLSSTSKLFVHDGAVGSSPRIDVKVRSVCDNPSAALAIQNVLCATPTRRVSHDFFPLTVYVATGFRPSAMEQLEFRSGADTGFIAADYERSALILGGKAFADLNAVKGTLAAMAAPGIISCGALPLAARILAIGNSVAMLFAPETLVQGSPAILDVSVTTDAGCAWSADGLETLFSAKDPKAPNLFKSPSSVILVTTDSSGVIPSISRLNPGQAAYHYVGGYQGESFVPAYQFGPASVDPLSLAKHLSLQLTNSSTPTFLINASDGEKIIADKDLLKLIEATLLQKLPKSKGKKPSESAVESLKAKYEKYMAKHFPELPEGISP